MDLGMSELLVIGIVALIVIGPKDLPEMFRQLGRFTAKMRAMAREFSRAMEQAANETGVSDIAKDLKAATNPKAMGMNAVKDAVDKFEKWDPIKNAVKPTASPAARVITPVAAAEPVAGVTPEMGPATKALAQKQAAKKAILAETAEKLKAVNAPTPVVKKAAAKPRAKPAAETAPVAPKPRAPRKTVKKAEEA